MDGAARSIKATSPSLNISVQLDADGYPRQLKLHCQHTDWLPAVLAGKVTGSPNLDLELLRDDKQKWQLKTDIASEKTLSILPGTAYAIALNRMHAEMNITIQPGSDFQLHTIDIQKLHWALADNHIDATGRWHDGMLNLSAASDRLDMPLIWSWLRPLGDQEWRHWLSQMHSGLANRTKADVALRWPNPLRGWPSTEAWNAMVYHLQTQVEDADLVLGISDDALLHSSVEVDMDQKGMHARVLDTELPRNLGHATAEVIIPWDTLDMHVSGSSTTDVARLLKWFGPTNIAGWKWNDAKAHSSFTLLWDLGDAAPKQASATLHPDGIWHVSLRGLQLRLSDGKVQWNQDSGLKLTDMHINNEYMQTTLSLQVARHKNDWDITALDASGIAQMKPLAAHFQLPLTHAAGSIATRLTFDDHWSGSLDLTQASWKQLLGSNKKAGDALTILYQGDLDVKGETPTINLNNLTSRGHRM